MDIDLNDNENLNYIWENIYIENIFFIRRGI